MQKRDILIVGQGLAGSLLALELEKRGKKVMILDNNPTVSSSKVAAGLYNPITGRKMVKTWLADELFPNLSNYYQALEKKMDARFHFSKTIYRPFNNIEEQNDWSLRTVELGYAPYIKSTFNHSMRIDQLLDPLGGFSVNDSGMVDVATLVSKCKKYFKTKELYTQCRMPSDALEMEEEKIKLGPFEAHQIIFCEGPMAVKNPLWSDLKFKLVKGEILDISCRLAIDYVVSKGIFMLPFKDYFRVGSTYDNQNQNEEPTDKGRRELLTRLSKLYKGNLEVLKHQAGLRPATFDRRPFVGFHAKHKNVGIFNGFGSKGVSLIPYFAMRLADHICFGKKIPFEVNPIR
jgi:glycine/D-amino acid oxidase-like deaminating enzyme|tara:strand:+ start:644 stop:1681 length:1038 start_codon:yes stop_codon:yes gene_type:complete